MRSRGVLAIAALGVSLAAEPVAAQTSSTVAETLFGDGKALMDQGKYEQACPKLAESQRLDPGGGTILNLAICYEKWGKTATAWATFKDALALARKDGRADREKLALERIAALEPKLPHMTVTVPDDARVPGLVVKVDGAELGAAAWGSALPVDPGEHQLEATAPGKKPWSAKLTAHAEQPHGVTIPALEDAPSGAEPSEGTAPPAGAGPAAAPGGEASDGSGQRTIGWIVTGVGVVGLGAGSVFGLSAIGKRKDADDHCPNDDCDDTGKQADEEAKSAATMSNVFFGVGVVGVGVGLYLVLSAPSGSEQSTAHVVRRRVSHVRVTPLVGAGSGGLGVSGRF